VELLIAAAVAGAASFLAALMAWIPRARRRRDIRVEVDRRDTDLPYGEVITGHVDEAQIADDWTEDDYWPQEARDEYSDRLENERQIAVQRVAARRAQAIYLDRLQTERVWVADDAARDMAIRLRPTIGTDRQARFANVRLTAVDDTPVRPETPMLPSSVVLLWIAIGRLDIASLVTVPAEFPRVSSNEVILTVLVTSTDFAVGNDLAKLRERDHSLERQLVLPADGPSRTPTGEPELMFALLAPTNESFARLRISYLFRDAVVQSQLLTAAVSGRVPCGVRVVTDYTASASLADLDAIPERPRFSLLTNDAGSSHMLVARASGETPDESRAKPTLVDGKTIGDRVSDLRIELHDRASGNLSRTRNDLIGDLRALAPIGRDLHRHLFVDLRGVIPMGSGPRPIINITRPRNVRFTLPWNYVYEIPFDSNMPIKEVAVCPVVTDWDQASPLVPPQTDECPRQGDVDHSADLLCPFGFWGFRQPLEAPPSASFADATVTVPPDSPVVFAESRKGINGKALDEHLGRLKKLLVDRFGPLSVTPEDTVTGLRKALATDLPLVYFLCHGHQDPSTSETWLGLGDKGEFFTWRNFVDLVTEGEARKQTIWDQVRPLIVINACHSLQIEPETLVGYVDAFSSADAKGVIGTEVRVPVPLAMAWAETFFASLIAGDDALTALQAARLHFLQHGNLFGLAYTAHCWAHLKLIN
jgi:hypothetical protein